MFVVTAILAMFVLSVAILSSLRIVYGMRQSRDSDLIYLILLVLSRTSLVLSICCVAILLAGWLSIPLLVLFAVTLLTAFVRHRLMQRKALLAMLSTVVEKNLPPGPALAAFAEGHPNAVGRAASRMAGLIEGGMPLSEAVGVCGAALPRFARVFTQAGATAGNVAPALREVYRLETPGGVVAQTFAGRVFYLFFLGLIWSAVTTFILLWVIPRFKTIFLDFSMDMPKLTQDVIASGDWVTNSWFLLAPFLLVVLMFFILWKLYDLQWISGVPVLERFDLSVHRAVVLRSLALAAEKDQALAPVLRSLSVNYPRAFIGRRLWNAAGDVEHGAGWRESLASVKLLSPSDEAVLASAERVGNLPWAMRLVADRGLRRSAYRMQTVLNWATPLVVIVLGLGVMAFVVGLFVPLVQIISSLSG